MLIQQVIYTLKWHYIISWLGGITNVHQSSSVVIILSHHIYGKFEIVRCGISNIFHHNTVVGRWLYCVYVVGFSQYATLDDIKTYFFADH